MSFRDLAKAFLAASPEVREKSAIEYKSLSGPFLGAGRMAHETVFTLKGSGEMRYFRRGDFGERGDAPPGLWLGKCDPAEVKEAWMIFGELNAESFPSRAADPGDTVSRLDGYVPEVFEFLSWGPPRPGAEVPGDEFLEYLAPLMGRTLDSRPQWAVEMALRGAALEKGALGLEVAFKNPGTAPIGLYFPKAGGRGGFTLRHAMDRDAPPGVTPLPVEWQLAQAGIPDREGDALWTLAPGEERRLRLLAAAELTGGRYLGKLQYEQLGPLDELAGQPILTGACFSEVLEFSL